MGADAVVALAVDHVMSGLRAVEEAVVMVVIAEVGRQALPMAVVVLLTEEDTVVVVSQPCPNNPMIN